MKKILSILLVLIIGFIPTAVLAGGTASGSAPSTVENGNYVTFTVNVNNVAAWNLKLSASGATNASSKNFADVTASGTNTSTSFSLTCKATSVGTITFIANGDITSEDGVNSNVSLKRTVSVVKPREKETESRLSALSVEGYKIDFDKDKDNYSIEVEPSVKSIKIYAETISGRASVSGIGKKEIAPDGGEFKVITIAENGAKKVYKIKVSVVDKNPIKVKINDIDYTVVKSRALLKTPVNSEKNKTIINDFEIPSYINNKAKITIIGLKDEAGEIKYSIYDDGKYKLYNENKSTELLLLINEKKLDDFEEETIIINESEYAAHKIDDRFKIVYAMNLNNGKYNYYKYDIKEKTFQYFDIEKENSKKDKVNVFLITSIIFIVTTLISIAYIICLKLKKIKKQNKVKK